MSIKSGQDYDTLEEISNDKRERYLAELRQKYIMDQKAIEDAGFDKGLKTGIEQTTIERFNIFLHFSQTRHN